MDTSAGTGNRRISASLFPSFSRNAFIVTDIFDLSVGDSEVYHRCECLSQFGLIATYLLTMTHFHKLKRNCVISDS